MTGRQTPLNSKLVSRAHRGPSTRATLKEFGAVARRVATMLRARGAARSSSASERFIGGGPGARAALDHHVERRARNMTRVPCRGTAGGSRGPRDAFLVEREPSTRRRTRAAATASSDAWSTRAVSDADRRDVMPNARARTTDAPTGRRDSLRAVRLRCGNQTSASSPRSRSRTARRSRGTRTSATGPAAARTDRARAPRPAAPRRYDRLRDAYVVPMSATVEEIHAALDEDGLIGTHESKNLSEFVDLDESDDDAPFQSTSDAAAT